MQKQAFSFDSPLGIIKDGEGLLITISNLMKKNFFRDFKHLFYLKEH